MRMTRPSAGELIVEENSLWLAWVLALAAVCLFYAGTFPGKRGTLLVGLLFLIFAALCVRKTRFVFNAGEGVVRWRNLVFFSIRAGSLAFDEIRDIALESTSGNSGSTNYRLSILTAGESIPIGASYGAGSAKYTGMRQAILEFVRPALRDAGDLESSIRGLVRHGRTVDAIALLRSVQPMTLTEATRRIEEIKEQIKAGGMQPE